MRAAVTTFGCDRGRSGIGRYLSELLAQFETLGIARRLDLVLDREQEKRLGAVAPSAQHVVVRRRESAPLADILWHALSLPRRCVRSAVDVLFLPAGNRRLPVYSPVPTIGTVHDLAPLVLPGKYDAKRRFYLRSVLPRLIRRLDRVLTVSESSARDIENLVGIDRRRIDVVPLGVDRDRYRPHPAAQTRPVAARHGITAPYLLYVSRLEHPGKNHVRLIEAFDRLRAAVGERVQLVLVGPDWFRAEAIHAAAARARFADDILLTGFVDGADLPPLVAGARAVCIPSLYEGFGLPVLEAMACDVPVACSDRSSLPEVAGDAALLFDPTEPDDIAATLETLLFDDGVRARLRDRGLRRSARYTWEATARGTWRALERTREERT
jgi:glycosyltransferase involved in cell wall biosynthesis